jgi:hypothetical protein
MARLSKKERESVYRAVCIFSDTYIDANDFSNEEKDALEKARLKMRMEIYGF